MDDDQIKERLSVLKSTRRKKKEKIEKTEVEKIEIEIEEKPKKKKKKEEEPKKKATNKDMNIILDIHIEIGDHIIDVDLNKMLYVPKFQDLHETPEKIGNILSETPALQARWNVLHSEAQKAYEQAKVTFDIWESNAYEEYRKQIIEEGERPTEGRIQKLINLDEDFKLKQFELTELKHKMNTVKAAAIGFASRGDKAVTLAHLLKKEMTSLDNTQIYSKKTL